MGREVTCLCRCGAEQGEVKALLESAEIILRGAIRRRVPLSDVSAIRTDGAHLMFKAGRDHVVLEIGAAEAAKWAEKMTTPPPSLRDKLGLNGDAKALVVGKVSDDALKVALSGATVKDPAKAAMVVAIVLDDDGLEAAVKASAGALPVWIVHGKGKGAAFGEAKVREGMRARGFIDTKVAAVSEALTATRYSPKR